MTRIDTEMEAHRKQRRRTRWVGLVIIPVAVVAVAASLYFYPANQAITFTIRTSSGEPADVYLNGEKVGQTPLELSYEDLQERILPDLAPARWPITGYRSVTARLKDLGGRLETGVILAQTDQQEQTYLVQETDAGRVVLAGGIRLKVVAADGRTGVNQSVSILKRSVLQSGKIPFEWKIDLPARK